MTQEDDDFDAATAIPPDGTPSTGALPEIPAPKEDDDDSDDGKDD